VVAHINDYPELCLGPDDLDTEIDPDDVMEQWLLHHGPSARAYHYLQSLDLGRALRGPNAVGGRDNDLGTGMRRGPAPLRHRKPTRPITAFADTTTSNSPLSGKWAFPQAVDSFQMPGICCGIGQRDRNLKMTAERHVRLFRNGRNQALRIPRELELEAEEAIIRREGDRLVIEPIQAAGLLAVLSRLRPLDEEFPDVDATLPLPDEIEL
jgi:antitoxin VapB